MIRDALPSLISRPGKPDIAVFKYKIDSLDVYADILEMVKELWDAHRSSFVAEPGQGTGDAVVDFAFGILG